MLRSTCLEDRAVPSIPQVVFHKVPLPMAVIPVMHLLHPVHGHLCLLLVLDLKVPIQLPYIYILNMFK